MLATSSVDADQLRQFARNTGIPCRNSLLQFTRFTHGRYVVSPFSRLICREVQDLIERTERGESVYKQIWTPPRFGKSEIAAIRGPVWSIGRNPDWEIIVSSYAQHLANDFSRNARGVVRNERYGMIFPEVTLNVESASVKQWEYYDKTSDVAMMGVFRAVGAGGSVTGTGGKILITDDPYKNAEEANSETIRRNRFEWYISTMRTRKMPGGSELVICTRWHMDGLAGQLLEEEGHKKDGGDWEVVRVPLFCDDPENDPLGRKKDEHLPNGRYDREWQEKVRMRMLSTPIKRYYFNAMYQQDPSPMGDVPFPTIERNTMTIEDPRFREYTPYVIFDAAESEDKRRDTTGCVVGGINDVAHRPIVYAEEIQEKPKARNIRILEIMRRLQAATGEETCYVEGDKDVILSIQQTFAEYGEPFVVRKLDHKGRRKYLRIEEMDNYVKRRDEQGHVIGTMDVGPEAEIFATRLTQWSRTSGTPDDLPDAGAYFCETAIYDPATASKWSGRPDPRDDPIGADIWDKKHGRGADKEVGSL